MPTNFVKTTEQDSKYRHLEKMPVHELLVNMNNEDKSVPVIVEQAIPQIEKLVEVVVEKLSNGGRLFYIGAGTSGRLGILDASEIPPTFGASPDLVNGIIAGGKEAITNAVERAEDSKEQGWEDLQQYNPTDQDVVVGIAASGTTPYVIGALEKCKEQGIITGCVTSNENSPLARVADYPIEVVVGPEFVTGSSRLKSGTAQKLVLNMITTSTMIRLGRVKDNKMVNMQLTNEKLVDRGTKMLMKELKIDDYEKARTILQEFGSVMKAIKEAKN
ncbi:N-acetylmuramic acid 6-phosphate etherase [Haoranjiania flava]|uniref:N-acetylmuramic acid 6-phosphate etherase n=1 Tax=Haoranjiania flava TaxID=1856322 RepID=A0AAE3LNF5_9BACT|nr:N-acetylmuramic acid 6-phosphate etherase [Haoranjiania flava]MCU7694961.1 N-acetylmuramic acid 6-phosphate etherase [Haoranjiania flava]